MFKKNLYNNMAHNNVYIENATVSDRLLTADDFAQALQDTISERLQKKIDNLQLCYTTLSNVERDQCILTIVRALQSPNLVKTGSHRLQDWEIGWAENLDAIQSVNSLDAIIPRYFGKHKYVRWKQNFVRPKTRGFDYLVLTILVEWMLEKYMMSLDNIYEFGCGPGYHLARARALNPHANLIGLDWAKSSQSILDNVAKKGLLSNVKGRNFNFFKPDENLEVPPNTGIYTVAALEQLGEDIEPFLQFLLKKKPVICTHLEPIDEVLDCNNLVDSLSQMYFRKRNYLKGFLPRLQELAKEGRIIIHKQQRTYTGSMFVEGHSLIAWSPK